jgi:hypothetical protein
MADLPHVINTRVPAMAWCRHENDDDFADDVEPDWPYELTDSQMRALGIRIQQYLTSEEGVFWDCIRDLCREMALIGGEPHLAKLPLHIFE